MAGTRRRRSESALALAVSGVVSGYRAYTAAAPTECRFTSPSSGSPVVHQRHAETAQTRGEAPVRAAC